MPGVALTTCGALLLPRERAGARQRPRKQTHSSPAKPKHSQEGPKNPRSLPGSLTPPPPLPIRVATPTMVAQQAY